MKNRRQRKRRGRKAGKARENRKKSRPSRPLVVVAHPASTSTSQVATVGWETGRASQKETGIQSRSVTTQRQRTSRETCLAACCRFSRGEGGQAAPLQRSRQAFHGSRRRMVHIRVCMLRILSFVSVLALRERLISI